MTDYLQYVIDHSNFTPEMVDSAKQQLADMYLTIQNLGADLEEMAAERDAIAKSISVTLDDGTAPDNLADHVELMMLQEYYPAIKKVGDMAAEIKSLKQRLAACQQDAMEGEE